MCFADTLQMHRYSLSNQAMQRPPGAQGLCGCSGLSGGKHTEHGAAGGHECTAGTYFLQEWHSRSPGWLPQGSHLAGQPSRWPGWPHASRSRQTAMSWLSAVIPAIFPAWNEEKQRNSAVCSPQRRGWDVVSTDPHAHTKPHSRTLQPHATGLDAPQGPDCQVPDLSLHLCARPWQQLKRAGEAPAPLWACVPSASPLPWLGSLPWRFAIATLKNWSCQEKI